MSASYQATGYIDVRIFIDDVYQCSGSATYEDIAEIIISNVKDKIGKAEDIKHGFKLEKIS